MAKGTVSVIPNDFYSTVGAPVAWRNVRVLQGPQSLVARFGQEVSLQMFQATAN